MKLINSDLFESNYDCTLVTCNSYIKQNGELVMGRGSALQLRKRFPEAPKYFGECISKVCGHLGEYGVLFSETMRHGIFQVKTNFREKATVELIENSTNMLTDVANELNYLKFGMNFPGIGNGRLNKVDVLSIIEHLPDNVFIHYL